MASQSWLLTSQRLAGTRSVSAATSGRSAALPCGSMSDGDMTRMLQDHEHLTSLVRTTTTCPALVFGPRHHPVGQTC